MKVEVLVSTVNSNPIELIQKMKIDSDAIIINQCDHVEYEEIKHNNNIIKIYSFDERGIGLSRNNALMRATGDIILFADDDEVLVNNYKEKIINEFKKNKKSDMIVFNIKGNSNNRKIAKILKSKKVHKYNCLRYGAVRFAVKLNSLRKKNISFSLLFGGGAKYGSGEDSIFIYDCLSKGIKIFSSTEVIASVNFENSTWFNGYNEKYYFDKGALFANLNCNLRLVYLLIVILKNHRNDKKNKLIWKLKKSIDGFKKFKNS